MPVFAILTESVSDDETIESKLQENYSDNFYRLGEHQWLVDANDTTKEVSEILGSNSEEKLTFVVFKVESYYGNHYQNLWDWLALPRSDDDKKSNAS